MALTASGIGTGLDISGIVDQLVAAERLPTGNRLNLQESRANAELSAVGSLKSAVTKFQDSLDVLSLLENFQKRKVTVGDEALFTAEVNSKAVPGFFGVDIQNLASFAKLTSGAFTDSQTAVGEGTLHITVDGVTSNIVIDSAANTLADIRSAINDDPTNPGVRATIVNADDGAHLIITSKSTGATQQITIAETGGGLAALTFDPLAPTNPLTEIQAAGDAVLIIDGITVTSSSNTVENAVEGITLHLLDADPGTVNDVDIEFDLIAAKTAVNEFVNSYNTLISTFSAVTNYDLESGVGAPLLGDPLVRGLKSLVRREINRVVEDVSGAFSTLANLGIQTEPDGKLTLDDTKLSAALDTHFDDVGELFAKENTGIAVTLNSLIDDVLNSNGLFDAREQTLKSRLERIGDQRERLDIRMESVRTRLTRQFNAMDRLVASLNTTSSFLTAQFANLSTFT